MQLQTQTRYRIIHDTLGPYSDPCGTAPKGTVGAGALGAVEDLLQLRVGAKAEQHVGVHQHQDKASAAAAG